MVIGENQIIRSSEHTNSNVFVFDASEQSFSCFLTGFTWWERHLILNWRVWSWLRLNAGGRP